jgi:hypothetical protein
VENQLLASLCMMSTVRDNQLKIIKYNHLIANLRIFHNCRTITLALNGNQKRATNAGMLLIYERILSAP